MGLESSKSGLGDFKTGSKVLGRGAFGKVLKGKNKKTGEYVAVKELSSIADYGSRGTMGMEEIKKLQHLSHHKHIVKLLDYFFKNQSFWIVMEYCDIGDLNRYMREYRPNLDSVVKIIHQCASAITYLHDLSPKVVHRDIKPANILVKTDNNKHVVKLTDFGISKLLDDQSVTAAMQTMAGTEMYMAPEMLAQKKYDESIDVFALGLVFIGMINFKITDERIYAVNEKDLLEGRIKSFGKVMYEADMKGKQIPDVVKIQSDDEDNIVWCKKLISEMVNFFPKKRPTALDILKTTEHWFRGTQQSSDFDSDVSIEDLSDLEPISSSDEEEENDAQGDTLRKEIKKYAKALKDAVDDSDDENGPSSDQDDAFQLRIGHRVIVDDDEKRVKEEIAGHGGWTSKMERYLGCSGFVKKVTNAQVTVRFDDGDWYHYSPTVLTKVSPTNPEPQTWLTALEIKRGDIVTIKASLSLQEFEKIQSALGKWTPELKKYYGVRGIVSMYDLESSLCHVEYIRLDNQLIHLSCLEVIHVLGEVIDVGDFVVITQDRWKAKTLQFGHGEWVTPMEKVLGHSGVVEKVVSHDRAQVRTSTKGRPFIWNMSCLDVIHKKAD